MDDLVMRSVYLSAQLDTRLRSLSSTLNRTRSDLVREFVSAGVAKFDKALEGAIRVADMIAALESSITRLEQTIGHNKQKVIDTSYEERELAALRAAVDLLRTLP